MNLHTDEITYIETIEKLELYRCIQDIMDRLESFDINEAKADHETAITWLAQLQFIKESTDQMKDLKEVLLTQSISELNGYTDSMEEKLKKYF